MDALRSPPVPAALPQSPTLDAPAPEAITRIAERFMREAVAAARSGGVPAAGVSAGVAEAATRADVPSLHDPLQFRDLPTLRDTSSFVGPSSFGDPSSVHESPMRRDVSGRADVSGEPGIPAVPGALPAAPPEPRTPVGMISQSPAVDYSGLRAFVAGIRGVDLNRGGAAVSPERGAAPAGSMAGDAALAAFYAKWRDEPLVVDKWLGVQARARRADTIARPVRRPR